MLWHKFIKFFLALIIIGYACIGSQVLAKVIKKNGIQKGWKGCILSDLWILPGQKIRVSWKDESLYNTHHRRPSKRIRDIQEEIERNLEKFSILDEE